MNKWVFIIIMLSFLACQKQVLKSPGPEPEDKQEMIPLEDMLSPYEVVDTYTNPRCGELVIESTGERWHRPNVDLIVSRVEIEEDGDMARIMPVIHNACDLPINQLFGILIRSDDPSHAGTVVFMGNVEPHADLRLGHTVGIPPGSSYTIMVDWDDRIDEANEYNNICVLSATGRCR